MKVVEERRGFRDLIHPTHENEPKEERLIGESPARSDLDSPTGSMFLWVGNRHHLDKEEVSELIQHLQHWLDTGRLPM